jgi:hypothetical protein
MEAFQRVFRPRIKLLNANDWEPTDELLDEEESD